MNLFKPITLKWWQVGLIKLTAFSFALIIASYWPVVLEWTMLWWILLILSAIYILSLFIRR